MDLLYINVSDASDLAHSLGFRNMHGNELRARSVADLCFRDATVLNARKRNRWEIDWVRFIKWLSAMKSNREVVILHECIRNDSSIRYPHQIIDIASSLYKERYDVSKFNDFDEITIDWYPYSGEGSGPTGAFTGLLDFSMPNNYTHYIELHYTTVAAPPESTSYQFAQGILLGPINPWCQPYMRMLDQVHEQNKKEKDNETT